MTMSSAVDVEQGRIARARCPYLVTAARDRSYHYPHGLACDVREGGSRAPSADELAWFCSNGRQHGCPTYPRFQLA
jgi:hypothetical protein